MVLAFLRSNDSRGTTGWIASRVATGSVEASHSVLNSTDPSSKKPQEESRPWVNVFPVSSTSTVHRPSPFVSLSSTT